ncbi:MAG: hypothetical protein WC026_16475 [Hyphomicrobium sp.]|uniref:hypothetical protein n=1 Tax=Hyphomicrobium sp. TaxID=82 RepID=UPI003565F093
MRVRLLVGLSGPTYTLGPGDERDFSQAEAIRLVAAGYAVPVAEREVERLEDAVRPIESRGKRARVRAQG